MEPEHDGDIAALIDTLTSVQQVDSLVLGGSRAANSFDADSDFDIYVYAQAVIPVELRRSITDRYFKTVELDNQYWETEDDGVLNDGTPVELIYRDPAWLESELRRVVLGHEASVGYSTCVWHNLLNSQILFDKNQHLSDLQSQYDVVYPEGLREEIIKKNLPLLGGAFPSFSKQISLAVRRDDIVSINHRVAAFLASYFDVLFAVNRQTHPGEKRLLQIASKCKRSPIGMEFDIRQLMNLTSPDANTNELLNVANQLESRLGDLVRDEMGLF